MKKLLIGVAISAAVLSSSAFASNFTISKNKATDDLFQSSGISISNEFSFGVKGLFLKSSYSDSSVELTHIDKDYYYYSDRAHTETKDSRGYAIGLGYDYYIGDTSFVEVVATHGENHATFRGDKINTDGTSAYVGYYFNPIPKIQLGVNAKWSEWENNTKTGYSVSGKYRFSKEYAVGVGYSIVEGVETSSLFGKIYF